LFERGAFEESFEKAYCALRKALEEVVNCVRIARSHQDSHGSL